MKKSSIVWIAFGCVAMCVSAWSETSTADILRQARAYQFQIRDGHYDVAPKFVAMMEDATKANPENADLSSAMGVAYLTQVAAVMLTGGNPADAWTGVQKGMHALEHALTSTRITPRLSLPTAEFRP